MYSERLVRLIKSASSECPCVDKMVEKYFSVNFCCVGRAAAISTNGIQIKDTHIQNIDLENEYELVEMDHQAHQESPKLIGTPVINRGPYFDTSASKNVTALVGKTAYLNCRVHNLGNRTVRHLKIHLQWEFSI